MISLLVVNETNFIRHAFMFAIYVSIELRCSLIDTQIISIRWSLHVVSLTPSLIDNQWCVIFVFVMRVRLFRGCVD